MPLQEYKLKRKFDKTPEPTGGHPAGKQLRFVVQKHHASHLHYDFRLELRGVLKSWAVPKGLSMNPEIKRLAMLVEDHPWDYRNFEGVIPSGYGAGTVIVWDEGNYRATAVNDNDKHAQEHAVSSQFWKGEMRFTLTGHKLKGDFRMVRAKDKGDNAWYISKLKDKYATTKDVTLKDSSVLSKKTLEQVAAEPEREWKSHKPAAHKKKKDPPSATIIQMIQSGSKKAMPEKPSPMSCTLIREPFDDPDWIYEVKIDGYRIMAQVKKGSVILRSRAGLNYTKYYPAVAGALKQLQHDVVIDGEVAVLDNDGRPDFDMLQKYTGETALVFYVFDILWIDGYDVSRLELPARKQILQHIIPPDSIIRYTEHFENGLQLYEQVKKMNLEGLVAKRKSSDYQEGKRSKDWLKLPMEIRQEFVIGGWTESGSGRSFRSLLFGAYEKGKLRFIGHSGLGYKDKEMRAILTKIKKLETKKNPFSNKVDAETTVHYIKPSLVGNFKFATWTAQGKIRKPAIFLGFRDDKDPKQVIQEVPLSENEEKEVIDSSPQHPVNSVVVAVKKTGKQRLSDRVLSADSNWKKLYKQAISSEQEFDINGNLLTLTNVEKELWPGITKAALIQYYHSIASLILPYLKDRPESLHIKHLKPAAPGMYIKDMEGQQPEWAEIFSTARKHKKKGKRDMIDYLVCQDEATLLYMVNLGCIDINPWTSRTTGYQQPDYIIIDLDPSDNDFKKVIKTALAAKKVFDKLKITGYPKTSGKSGMHLYIPCEGFTFPEARTIAINICKRISALLPHISTTENSIAERGDKVFVDYNQNDEADTVAAPYSVRPWKEPTVSTPLQWREINLKLHPRIFTINTILQRIKSRGDLFKDVLSPAVRKKNTAALSTLL